MRRNFQIADLIVAFIKGEISSDDLVVLDEWMDESEENKALFVSLMDEAVFNEKKKMENTEKLNDVFEQIKRRKRQIIKKRRIRLFTAIAASVLIIFSVFLFVEYSETPPVVAKAEISVGKQMAYLLLATGEKIVLKQGVMDTVKMSCISQQIILNNGGVEIREGSSDTNGTEEYHTMETPRGAEYSLTLPDGTKVWMNAGSKLRFPVAFNDTRRYVELSGEAYFAVTKDEMRPFVVHSGEMDITVLGTEFCVRSYINKPMLTTLVSGRVEVSTPKGWKSILQPGQQAVNDGEKIFVREVDPHYYTAWKDGYFIFNDTPLGEIMEELSLWYDCSYFFENQSVEEIRITARLKKYDEIDTLLDILSKTNEIQVNKNGVTILIRQK